MIKVFIASPYLHDNNMFFHVKRQHDVANRLIEEGFAPFIPLLFHYQNIIHLQPEPVWKEIDIEFLSVCDCILRLPGESTGADYEVKKAKEFGKEVFYSIEELVRHYNYVQLSNEVDKENSDEEKGR